jgi:hypothetical protein
LLPVSTWKTHTSILRQLQKTLIHYEGFLKSGTFGESALGKFDTVWDSGGYRNVAMEEKSINNTTRNMHK